MASSVEALPVGVVPHPGPWRRVRRLAARSKAGTAALAVIAAFIVIALASPLLAPADPLYQDYDALLTAPSAAHPFGTDQVGRDLLSRVMYGTRVSLVVGLISVGIAIVVGTPIGLVSGYFRGLLDDVLMRIIDAFIAFPSLILALAIVTVLKPSVFNVMLAIGVTYIPIFARLMRSQVLSIRTYDYVSAARSLGANDTRIMLRHVLPNALSPIIVQATLGLGFAVLAEASLGYLGVGVQPPTPTWGSALNQGAPLLERAPWLSIFPGLAILILVLAFNLLGDALRDQLDPRLRGR
jgi:peptide/nickel transport system permease protein